MTSEQRHKVCDYIGSLGSNAEIKFVRRPSGDLINFRLHGARSNFAKIIPKKNGYRFVALLPDIDYNNSNEYDNIKQESARCGFKFDEKYPLYFRVTVKDEKTQNDALDFATLIYKVWDEYINKKD